MASKIEDLSKEQKSVLRTVVQETSRAPRKVRGKVRKAGVETGLVEATLRNPTRPGSGDGTSIGWRQETASSYPNVDRTDVKASARRFTDEATKVALAHPGISAGALAQAVQRSAYPGRYAEHSGEASALTRAVLGSKAGRGSRGSRSGGSAGTPGAVITSSDPVTAADPALQQLLAQSVRGLTTGAAVPQPAAAVDPWFTARRALPSATGVTPGFESQVQQPAGQASIDELIAELAQTPADPGLPATQTTVIPGTAGSAGSKGGSGAQVSSGGHQVGKAVVAPGADRAGASTQAITKKFVGLVAGATHQPVTITTGTNHNRLTVDGNVSDHWTGHAADIGVPVDSHKGDVIASAALQLIGFSAAQAHSMVKKGGLWTRTPTSGPLKGKRVQVIWRTMQGGNHHNHVHLGVR